MEIVIDIPDNFNLENEINTVSNSVIRKALKNGTPLPEHGRLIDADAIDTDNVDWYDPDCCYEVQRAIDTARTIVPATKESEDKE